MYMLTRLFIIPIVIYLYFFIKRSISIWPIVKKKSVVQTIALAISLLIGYISMDMFSLAFLVCMHGIVISLLFDGIHWIVQKYDNHPKWDWIYRSGGLVILVCALYMGYGYINMQSVQDTSYTYASDKIKETVKLAFVSDLHMGTTMDGETLIQYCQEIEKHEVDMVLLGGDMVDESTSLKQLQQCATAFGNIQSKYGTYYVYGNHDSFAGRYVIDAKITKEDVKEQFQKANIHILEEETKLIDNQIYIIGRKDASFYQNANRLSLETLTKDIDTTKYTILLDHQPLELEKAAQLKIDLLLSGHTHGGQIWPLGEFNKLVGANELEYGQKQIGDFHAVVSSGLGGWKYPIRTISKSEIVYLTISKNNEY